MNSTSPSHPDTDPEPGLDARSDGAFADPANRQYPIDTPEHIRAAWSEINQSDNAARYAPEEVEIIKDRIRKAAGKHDIDVNRAED